MHTKIVRIAKRFFILIPSNLAAIYNISEMDMVDFNIVDKKDYFLVNITIVQQTNHNKM